MTHRFPIKEIALQSGLGTATVDRVLNGRAHVSPQTRLRVSAAISELEGQEQQLAARGRRMFFDFVVEAPMRFSQEVRRAAEAVLPRIGAAVCRPRFALQETMSEEEVVADLDRIAARGSQGVCLKARDLPGVRSAIGRLTALGIPVVTLVTDIPASPRLAYVGLDNASAGRTSAYLMHKGLRGRTGTILATRSQISFLGEEERARAFAETLGKTSESLRIVEANGGSGLSQETAREVAKALRGVDDLVGVYSMGGGNKAILDALPKRGLASLLFVAHDLDRENLALLRAGQLTYVLHHDLRADLLAMFRAFLRHHRLKSDPPDSLVSGVQILTPENIGMY
jgi:LacI family transcriptional regulator